MNILMIPSWYSTKQKPTNGSFFREQAIELTRLGHCVYIIYVEETIKPMSDNEKEILCYIDNGIITYKSKVKKIPKSGNIGTSFAIRKGLLSVMKSIEKIVKFDLIHLQSCIWAGLGAVAISEKYNVPLIITEHSSYYRRYNQNFIENLILKYIFSKSKKVICVSNSLKEAISKYRKDVEVIHNMVDCSLFTYDICKTPKNFTFLTVCYLNKNKRVDLLLKAFEHEFRGKDINLIIGGDGPEFENLKLLTKKLKIENQVLFLGTLDRERIIDVMQQCHVFVLPSKIETFGIVLIEAMACGKPVISFDNGGAKEIVTDNNGFIIKEETYIALGKTMTTIMNNYEQYDFCDISNNCKLKFDKISIMHKIEDAYKEAIK